jgi:hypothetical protein
MEAGMSIMARDGAVAIPVRNHTETHEFHERIVNHATYKYG